MSKTDQPSFDEYANALRELEKRHGHAKLELNFGVLIAIIGACQLALKHPDFPAYLHGLVTRWITDVANALPSEPVRQTILNGFNPEFDQDAVELAKNDIIQITDDSHPWFPALLIVDEVKAWGVIAYCSIPRSNNKNDVGQAYNRLQARTYERVGVARIFADIAVNEED